MYCTCDVLPRSVNSPEVSVGGGGDGNYKRKMEDEGDEEERSAKNPRSASPDFTSLKVTAYTYACIYMYMS